MSLTKSLQHSNETEGNSNLNNGIYEKSTDDIIILNNWSPRSEENPGLSTPTTTIWHSMGGPSLVNWAPKKQLDQKCQNKTALFAHSRNHEHMIS